MPLNMLDILTSTNKKIFNNLPRIGLCSFMELPDENIIFKKEPSSINVAYLLNNVD
jgi:hypothetical protein